MSHREVFRWPSCWAPRSPSIAMSWGRVQKKKKFCVGMVRRWLADTTAMPRNGMLNPVRPLCSCGATNSAIEDYCREPQDRADRANRNRHQHLLLLQGRCQLLQRDDHCRVYDTAVDDVILDL